MPCHKKLKVAAPSVPQPKKGWPFFYPSGNPVPAGVRQRYRVELKKVRKG